MKTKLTIPLPYLTLSKFYVLIKSFTLSINFHILFYLWNNFEFVHKYMGPSRMRRTNSGWSVANWVLYQNNLLLFSFNNYEEGDEEQRTSICWHEWMKLSHFLVFSYKNQSSWMKTPYIHMPITHRLVRHHSHFSLFFPLSLCFWSVSSFWVFHLFSFPFLNFLIFIILLSGSLSFYCLSEFSGDFFHFLATFLLFFFPLCDLYSIWLLGLWLLLFLLGFELGGMLFDCNLWHFLMHCLFERVNWFFGFGIASEIWLRWIPALCLWNPIPNWWRVIGEVLIVVRIDFLVRKLEEVLVKMFGLGVWNLRRKLWSLPQMLLMLWLRLMFQSSLWWVHCICGWPNGHVWFISLEVLMKTPSWFFFIFHFFELDLILQTIQVPTVPKVKANPKNVASIILGGGAGTHLFPLTKRSATPAVRNLSVCIYIFDCGTLQGSAA